MAKKPATQAVTEAAAAINTLSMDAGVGGKLTKAWADLPCRKIYRVPSLPDGVQIKGGHMQIRFGGLYISRTLSSGELTGVEYATFNLSYQQAKASGQTSPSYSGSGEPYVPVTVTPTVSVPGGPTTGGLVQLDGLTLMTFELDPTVNLSKPTPSAGVYHGAPDDDPDEDPEDPEDDGDDD